MARTAHRTFEQILDDAIRDEGFDPDTLGSDDYWPIYDQLLEDLNEEKAQNARDIERGL